MSSFMNMRELTSLMEIRNNLDNLGKIEESTASKAAPSYMIADYPTYGHQQMDLASQKQNFDTLSTHHTSLESTWQNGVLPLNLNTYSGTNYSNDYTNTAQPNEIHDFTIKNACPIKNPLDLPNAPLHVPSTLLDAPNVPLNVPNIPLNVPNVPLNVPNVPLNVPIVPPEAFHNDNEVSYGLFNANKDKFNNFHNNFETNNTNKPLLDSERKKSLENTVRLIENILMNTANNKKLQSETDAKGKGNASSDINKKITEKQKPTESNKTGLNKSSVSDEITITENDSVTIEISQNIAKEHENSNNNESPSKTVDNDKLSSPQKQKSVNFENVVIKQEKPDEEYSCPIETEVSIKIEPVDSLNFIREGTPDDYNDIENMTPFQRDEHGVARERIIEEFNGELVNGELSFEAATNAIKNGSNTKQYYECPHCNIYFEHPKRFLIHYKWHSFGLTNEKRMMIAKAREQRKNELKEARVVSRMNAEEVKVTDDAALKDEKVYSCKDCDKMFVSKSSLKNHRQRFHPVLVRECKICGKHVPGWKAMRVHVASHSSGAGFPCTHCDKQFSSAHSLAKHSGTHMEKTMSCPECPKMFATTAQLRTHQRVHEREKLGKRFSCSECGKLFHEVFSLNVHERTHRNERPFECEICHTSFGTNSGLKRHVKVSHNAAKPFECPTCHRSFVSENIRDRHELRHHGDPSEFPYPCQLCDCRYLKQKDLNKHIHKSHPKVKTKKKNASSSDEEYFG